MGAYLARYVRCPRTAFSEQEIRKRRGEQNAHATKRERIKQINIETRFPRLRAARKTNNVFFFHSRRFRNPPPRFEPPRRTRQVGRKIIL